MVLTDCVYFNDGQESYWWYNICRRPYDDDDDDGHDGGGDNQHVLLACVWINPNPNVTDVLIDSFFRSVSNFLIAGSQASFHSEDTVTHGAQKGLGKFTIYCIYARTILITN